MATLSWLSRIVLGREEVAAKESAEEKFTSTLNGHQFNAEALRAQLKNVLLDVEEKAAALSSRPPENDEEPTDDDDCENSRSQPEHRAKEA